MIVPSKNHDTRLVKIQPEERIVATSEEIMEKLEENIEHIKKYGVKRKQYILGSVKYAARVYFEAYLKDILDAIRKIKNYTKAIAFDDFVNGILSEIEGASK